MRSETETQSKHTCLVLLIALRFRRGDVRVQHVVFVVCVLCPWYSLQCLYERLGPGAHLNRNELSERGRVSAESYSPIRHRGKRREGSGWDSSVAIVVR